MALFAQNYPQKKDLKNSKAGKLSKCFESWKNNPEELLGSFSSFL